jgi:hypothetical protein
VNNESVIPQNSTVEPGVPRVLSVSKLNPLIPHVPVGLTTGGLGINGGGVVEPDAVEPDAVEPDAVEPEAVEPEAVEPEAVEPGEGL